MGEKAMIKFIAGTAKGTVLGLGLSKKNVNLLKKGKPIHFYLAETNLDISRVDSIMIMYGSTEEKIKKKLEPFFSSNVQRMPPPTKH